MGSTGSLRFEFRVLGPFEVVSGGRVLEIGSAKQRALLALLLIHLNRPVSLDAIGEELWEGNPPASLGATVQSLVYRIRKLLGPDAEAAGVGLRGRGSGYLLEGEELQLDAHRFERLASRGRELAATGAFDTAARAFRDAVGLWRGPALDGLAELPFARLEAARLEGARLLARGRARRIGTRPRPARRGTHPARAPRGGEPAPGGGLGPAHAHALPRSGARPRRSGPIRSCAGYWPRNWAWNRIRHCGTSRARSSPRAPSSAAQRHPSPPPGRNHTSGRHPRLTPTSPHTGHGPGRPDPHRGPRRRSGRHHRRRRSRVRSPR